MKLSMIAGLVGALSLVAVTTAEARPVRHIHVKPVVHTHKVVVKPAPKHRVLTTLAALAVLPDNHIRVVRNGETYYYHDGVYYVKEPRGYVVVRFV